MMKSAPCRLSALAVLAAVIAPAHAVTSTFDLDAEGWTAQGDVAGAINWTATGGNPGGHVNIDDRTAGGVTYFVAPAAFLGNKAAALGTNLTFDLMQVYTGSASQFDDPDVILAGGGLTLVYDTAVNPANGSWTSYAVPLMAGDWKLNSLSGALATPHDMATTLSNLTSLSIRAEYRSGADVGHLDNVTLVPEPTTGAMVLVGLLAVGMGMWRQRRVG
jgi:hypothetical protein